ncbi:type III glutamate--ammonia ligase [Leptothrix discophora]|uniref:Type III glutamate--ammonia ligase n=1 Tax=Leptothrix discophora TaxID=89 RepID=A0ABT9G2K0_LEPDI|nr:type III glutamate--ammonia ligase [Leptothrix discophora]MDP4300711.1 type III glutamate--ammonia ligase [Leptothrix discophora]
MHDARVLELKRLGVHTLLVQFTDVHGVAKGKLVPLDQLASVLAHGAGFAGPSIAGTGLPRTGPRAEYMARGDLATLQPLPWWLGVARIVGDGHVAGEPFDACPRQVLRRQVARLAAEGWQLQLGIEPEFFLLRREADGSWRPADALDRLDKPSYDLQSLPRQAALLQALRAALEADGAEVQQIDHEDAHGQYELNFRHDQVLASCDRLMLFKLAAQRLAEQHGCVCSFMPKPWANQPGSGLHFHVSLWDGDRPAFDDLDEHGHLVDRAGRAGELPLARHFIAGVLAHSAALCAMAAPTVNSYKRLVVGESLSGTSWAPAYVAHGANNRTALVRTLPGRFEWRLPDASANPYLAAAGLIAAGLDGIARRLEPGPAIDDDLFALDLATIHARGIAVLPQSLAEAADALAVDAVLAEALGSTLHTQLLALQRDEWLQYARHVSAWELARYAAR